MLADGINAPLVLGYGLAVLVPLTLIVVVLEMLVLRRFCGIRLAVSFKVLVEANVLSTAAGWIVYLFQDWFLEAIGIRTLPDFLRLYLYGAMLLIVAYYAVSVVVEAVVAVRRKLHEAAGISRKRLWRGIALANVVSYLVVGPLFYFGTRPNLGELTLVDDPAEVTDCGDTVYFLATDSGHLCRINADGTGFRALTGYPVEDFFISRNQQAFICRGADGGLYFHHAEGPPPVFVRRIHESFSMTCVDIAADGNRIAYANGARVTVFDAKAKRTIAYERLPEYDYAGSVHLAWDPERPDVLHCRVGDARLAWTVGEIRMIPSARPARGLLGGYCRRGGGIEDLDNKQERGELSVYTWPYLGTRTWVTRGRQTLALLHDNYGVLGLGFRGPTTASFLSARGVVVCDGRGCLYVLNALDKKLALLADGRRHVLADGRFQTSFDEEEPEKE